nr:5101_t:CDS:2 [Entrophospora candida]CAG8437740.1 5104_t:CDS:2 [Entrophospora candida]
MLSRDFNNISSDKIMLMSNFSSIIRRSFQTSSVKNRFEPSKGKGVVGLYEFFQNGVDSPNPLPRTNELYPVGNSWQASVLRTKSFEDLHRLWYILLKERNMLATMYEEARRWRKVVNPEWINRHHERSYKCQKSMARIKFVLSERRVAYEHAKRKYPALFGIKKVPKPHKSYREPSSSPGRKFDNKNDDNLDSDFSDNIKRGNSDNDSAVNLPWLESITDQVQC